MWRQLSSWQSLGKVGFSLDLRKSVLRGISQELTKVATVSQLAAPWRARSGLELRKTAPSRTSQGLTKMVTLVQLAAPGEGEV